MLLLYWLVIIILSISAASVVSESEVGLIAHTIVPSPTPDCWSPSCLTWLQCLADPSQCFTSHTTVTMQPGEYILHEYVGVYDVVSLAIYGTRSKVNDTAKENQVVINCEYREGGFGFMDVANFSLSGITVVSCGVQGETGGFMGDPDFVLSYFALYIFEGINVNLSFLVITNSTQIGLLFINPLGISSIQDSVITHSNYRLLEKYKQRKVDCSVDNWECCGSNLWVQVYKPVNKVASNFTVERTIISYGVNFITGQIGSPFSNGAGAIVRVEPGLEYDVHITFSKCYFSNNIALYATHLQVGIYSNCSLLIENSNFPHTNKKRSGPCNETGTSGSSFFCSSFPFHH